MTSYLSKDTLLGVVRAERDEPSEVFGGMLRLRELSRKAYVDGQKAAEIPGQEGMIYVEKWNAFVFAAGVVDPETKQPMFAADEISEFGNNPRVWTEVMRVAQCVLDLSEVGQAAFPGQDTPPNPE